METPQDGPDYQNATPHNVPPQAPPAYGQPMPAYGQPGQPGQYYQPVNYPEESQSTTVLVLGILGLVMCQVLAPFAWKMGNAELAAIDAGRRSPTNREHANIGRILGIIGTIMLLFVVALFVLWMLIVFGALVVGGVSSAAAL